MAFPEHFGVLRRASIEIRDVVVVLIFIGAGLLLIPPMLAHRSATPKRVICASNLRGIGQGLHIYANDNDGTFPIHYHEPAADEPANSD